LGYSLQIARKRTKARMEFGYKVRKRRYDLDWSIEKLAEKAGLHPNYVGSVERGERNIALENIILLAQALGLSPRDLMPE
jgi:transcriptional regulator with XRE-family HTH domain